MSDADGAVVDTDGSVVGPDGDTPDPDAGDPLAQCPGVPHTANGVRDIDLEAIDVSGLVTLKGGSLPPGSSGTIGFRRVDTLTELWIPFDSGVTAYSVTLSPGVYDLLYRPDAFDCERPADTQMPCVSGVLATQVVLMADGVLDIDIPVVRLSGTVALCNADGSGCRALPDEPLNRGALRFVHPDGAAISAPFETAGAVSYDIGLLPGPYGIELVANPALCDATTPPQVPCIDAGLDEVTVSADGVYDVEIPALQLSGGVRLCAGDGSGCGALPDEAGDRGALRFNLASGGGVTSRPFGATGAVTYALTLVPGSYTVDLLANSELCRESTLPETPCGGGQIMGPVTLSADGVLDVELPTVSVTGQVQLCDAAGASCTALPAEASDRGAIHFERAQGGGATTAPLGSSGSATYALRLLAGDYTVHFAANSGLCDGASAPRVPCVGGPLRSGVVLRSDGVLDVAIPAVQLSGRVTLCDASASGCVDLPDESANRGAIGFTLDPGEALSLPLGATGPYSYAVTLLPGAYEISYERADTPCEADSIMPCLRGALLTSAITASGVLDIPVPTVTVGGLVTLEGATLPNAFGARGEVTFALRGGGVARYGLGTTGAESYGVRLLPGNYVVSHGANEVLCDGTTAPGIPCTDTINAGCEP